MTQPLQGLPWKIRNEGEDKMTEGSYVLPEGIDVDITTGKMTPFSNHYEKRLNQMKGFYQDTAGYDNLLREKGDIITYEVFETIKSTADGDMIFGTSILYPGKVGFEYFMTKGHSHARADTAEIYYCLAGEGFMLLESPSGTGNAVRMLPCRIVYVPPYWAHRSVNTGKTKMISIFAYPADAGHVYGKIEKEGMTQIVVEKEGKPCVVIK
jgi:glucose-6-phosphate isomerase